MKYFIFILTVTALVFLAYRWINYLKTVRGTEAYAKRRIFTLLFLAFMTLVSATTVFANALFELMGLDKPAQFEWMGLAAFAILAFAAVRIIESGKKSAGEKSAKTTNQVHHGTGDNVGSDKVGRDKVMGDIVIHQAAKKKVAKELTPLHPVNPDDIVGRSKDLEELHDLLFDNKKVVLVNGLGGIGKTTLAGVYVFKNHSEYKHIAWIDSDQSFEDDIIQHVELIANLEIETEGVEPQHIYREVLRRLRGIEDGPNLLIIDNADEHLEKNLGDLPSQPNWHLLVTSRETIASMHPKKLGFLSLEESVKLFQKHCDSIDDLQEIEHIVKMLDFHTLSIEILAKTAQRRGTSFEQLTTAIEDDIKANIKIRHSALKEIDRITSYLCSIFDLSNLSTDETSLMQQFSCLPPKHHEVSRLRTLLLEKDDHLDDFQETLNGLTEKGWLLKAEEANAYKMHRIIGEVINQKHKPSIDDLQTLIKQVSELLSIDQSKDNPIDKFKWAPFGQAILNRFIDSQAEGISRLQNNLALVLKDLGDYKGARELLEKAKSSDEKNLGVDHPTTTASYSNLAMVVMNLGDYKGARDLLEKAISSHEKNLGVDHPATAVYYSNLALVLQDLGDYESARALLEKAMSSDEKNFGVDHPTTAVRYSNLATVLKDLGNYEGARDLLEKAKSSAEKNFGVDHPTTTVSYSNLATVLRALGDYNGARDLLEKTKYSAEKNFGVDHPITAVRYSNLALVLKDLGDYNGARDFLEKAKSSNEKNFGVDHPTTAVNYSNLAMVLKALGDHEGARDLLEKAKYSAEKNFGVDHPTTAVRYSNLALVLQALGDLEGARDLLEKAKSSTEKNLGIDHPTTAIRYSNLAAVFKGFGEFEKAIALFRKAMAIMRRNLPEGHPYINKIRQNLTIVEKEWMEIRAGKKDNPD